MYYIDGTDISITRGDSAYIKININNANGLPYELHDEDIVRVQVRTGKNTGTLLFEGLIERDKDDKCLVWHIRPEDTKDKLIKKYYYDMQLELPNGDIFTFIPVSYF